MYLSLIIQLFLILLIHITLSTTIILQLLTNFSSHLNYFLSPMSSRSNWTIPFFLVLITLRILLQSIQFLLQISIIKLFHF